MCTVTLSYDKNDKVAKAKLEALLSTGLFVQLDKHDELNIDYSDPSLYEEGPSMPEINRDLTPEELERIIIDDIHSIYQSSYAV